MEHNTSPVSMREGKVFLDGVEVMDCVVCTVNFTPEVWNGRQLRERTPSSRWLGATITGSMTRRRTTPWLKDIIKKYLDDGVTPEFTIQGLMDDKGSDYYKISGSDLVTCVGCVLTGDFPLTRLDSEGQIVDDVVGFNVKKIV